MSAIILINHAKCVSVNLIKLLYILKLTWIQAQDLKCIYLDLLAAEKQKPRVGD